jgi:hypothetical protein
MEGCQEAWAESCFGFGVYDTATGQCCPVPDDYGYAIRCPEGEKFRSTGVLPWEGYCEPYSEDWDSGAPETWEETQGVMPENRWSGINPLEGPQDPRAVNTNIELPFEFGQGNYLNALQEGSNFTFDPTAMNTDYIQQIQQLGLPAPQSQQEAYDILMQMSQDRGERQFEGAYGEALKGIAGQESLGPEAEQAAIDATIADIDRQYEDAIGDLQEQINEASELGGAFHSGARIDTMGEEMRKLIGQRESEKSKIIEQMRVGGLERELQRQETRVGAAETGGALEIEQVQARQADERLRAEAAVASGQISEGEYNQILQRHEQELAQAQALGAERRQYGGMGLEQQEARRRSAETWGAFDIQEKQNVMDFALGEKQLEVEDALKRGELDVQQFNSMVAQNLGISEQELQATGKDLEIAAMTFDYMISKSADERAWREVEFGIDQFLLQMDYYRSQQLGVLIASMMGG